MNEIVFIITIVGILACAWILPTLKRNPKRSKMQVERLRYFRLMRKYGIKEWIIQDEYKKIKSLKELKEKNATMQKHVDTFNL